MQWFGSETAARAPGDVVGAHVGHRLTVAAPMIDGGQPEDWLFLPKNNPGGLIQ